jgi:hypothetical protein
MHGMIPHEIKLKTDPQHPRKPLAHGKQLYRQFFAFLLYFLTSFRSPQIRSCFLSDLNTTFLTLNSPKDDKY